MLQSKVKDVRIWGVTNQNSTVRLTVGDSSAGTFTAQSNPLRGTLFWDNAQYILQGVSVAGGATGGSYTVTIQTDAVLGVTALPIAQAVIGPLTKKTVVMDNVHHSSGSPLPTHLNINQTASGGGIWLQCTAVARQYRGILGTPGAKTSERILQGFMLRGTSAGGQFASDRGIDASTTFTLGTTGSNIGMHRLRLWDRAAFWVKTGNTVSGAHDVSIIGKIGGVSVTIATTGTSGIVGTAGTAYPLISQVYGTCPNPTQIIWGVSAAGGVSDARIIGMAKSGRGSASKN